MFVLGLTGGIGSGKSKVSEWFTKQGVVVVDADVLARQVVAAGSKTLRQIVTKFGDWVLTAEDELDRRAMREYIFARPQALMDLEQITHPAIRHAAKQQVAAATSPYVVLVAPLLLEASEAGLANLCQRVLVIDSREDLQVARASTRDGQTVASIERIMANQLSREARLAQADDVVINNASLAELYAQLELLHQRYLAMAAQSA